MANPEHLALLKNSVAGWNEWRKENANSIPDLSLADLRGAVLREANLTRTDLGGAFVREADLGGADLRQADLIHANLTQCDLTRADLGGAYLSYANCSGANLRQVLMIGADLTGADLRAADLNEAILSRATFREAYLSKAILSEADLNGTDLSGADLSDADFTKAYCGFTSFANVDLSAVKGLAAVTHYGPSTIGVDTIFKSGGNIPEVFLLGAGVPDHFIAYIRSLVGKAIEFYSCFISFSTKDREFAEKLYADLKTKGVRCYFAPEHLKIGDKFTDRIEESIRLYDKLLIVLSERAIASPWVRREVEAALEREDRQKNTILFPIRVDDGVTETNEAWAADIRRTRHIGDFSRWKDHDSYELAFNRLLRDLRQSGG